MIKLETNQFAIRSIIKSNVDCEWGKVNVFLDEVNVISSIKSLYDDVIFVNEIDDNFIVIDEIRVSGQLNLIYAPAYSNIIKLYYYKQENVYVIKIEQ